MKILFLNGWESDPISCAACRTVMTIDESDLLYSSYSKSFYTYCGHCREEITLRGNQGIPEEARLRASSHTGSVTTEAQIVEDNQ